MSSSPARPAADKPFNRFNRIQAEQAIQKDMRKKMGFSRDPRPLEIPGRAADLHFQRQR